MVIFFFFARWLHQVSTGGIAAVTINYCCQKDKNGCWWQSKMTLDHLIDWLVDEEI